MHKKNNSSEFIAAVKTSLDQGQLIKLNLGHYTGDDHTLKNIIVRPIMIKNELMLSFTYRHLTRDLIKNYTPVEFLNQLQHMINHSFHAATLFTPSFNLILENNKTKKLPPSIKSLPDMAHDRQKNHLFSANGKDYLYALGLTDHQGHILKTRQDKFRQINKYIEIVGNLFETIETTHCLKIIDMGSGKGYLTFALYDYLNHKGMAPDITGVEYRDDLVQMCTKIAHNSGFDRLHFVQGSIENYQIDDPHTIIALHACDTATDDAIAKGIMGQAEMIIVSPCCHKQIRREMEQLNQSHALNFLIKHGIFLERQAEMVTDGLRAMILEYFGYKTKIFEFISDAHTAKNTMITAVKNKNLKQRDPEILEKIKIQKSWFGIRHHHLETLLDI